MTKNQFAVRHIPTGNFLPANSQASYWNPLRETNPDVPRLVPTARIAKNLASTWARQAACPKPGYTNNKDNRTPAEQAAVDAKRAELEIIECAVTQVGVVG